MYATDHSPAGPITLRVSDAERSRAFYQDLFGLVPGEPGGRLLRSPDEQEGMELSLEPRGDDGAGADLWLSVQVQGVTEVLDLYLLAIMIGAHASLPRKRGDRWNTVVTDPDGHKISIWTLVPRQWGERERVPGRRSPRWEWERSQRPGYDAGRARESVGGRSRCDPERSERRPGEAASGTREQKGV
ncbi:MAG: VOC family protein [Phycisphaerales bacterium]